MDRPSNGKNQFLLNTFEAITKYGVVRHEAKYKIRRWTVGLSAVIGGYALVSVLSGNGDEIVNDAKSAAKIAAETVDNAADVYGKTICTGVQQFRAQKGSTLYDFAELVEYGSEVPASDVVDEIIELNRTADEKTDSEVISIFPGQTIYAPLECHKD